MLIRIAAIFLTTIISINIHSTVYAKDEETNLGRLMWSAFSCATYAELSGSKDEQARLFLIGYNAGKAFLEGVKNGTISEAQAQKAPIGVLMNLGGPSIDFMVGAIFKSSSNNAYDSVVKKNEYGVLLEPSKWVTDDKLKNARAENKYHNSNCELIQ